ncbi:hypothetical protein AURDEDRAFT_187504 [Auricularia subglabra TFB-10046 SS5]|nr:hypothetical protein AURDEDRAFT_187504 [Auricularia subglabra TFB-10046 SS5]
MLRNVIHARTSTLTQLARAAHTHHPLSARDEDLRERASHNLSERHARLAKSIQYKHRYALAPEQPSDAPKDPAPLSSSGNISDELVQPVVVAAKMGSIPPKPVPPGPEECCMSNCAVCVHDLYAEALAEWKEKYGHTEPGAAKEDRNVSMDAFAALEASLAAKRAAQEV